MHKPNIAKPLPIPSTKKFSFYRAPRALLARDADSMYWMSRYVERAEHVARLLLVHTNLLVDVGDLSPMFPNRQWQSVLKIMHLPNLPDDTGGASALASTPALSQRIAQHM